MAVLNRRPWLRWLAPVVAALLLVTGGSVIAAISASARDSLPARTAAQLLVDVQKAQVAGLSGTVVQTADLGLPSLPGVGGEGASSDFSSLVSGSHTLRVWYAGPDKARIALLGDLGESDLVRNGSDLWQWSSTKNEATHLTVPQHSDRAGQPGDPSELAMTPQKAAANALAAIDPTTAVRTNPTAEVAGRSAYELVLEPKDAATLVGSVRIAVDGATHLPTRVQVFAKGATDPAFEVGFTSFDPTVPDDSVFAFNPPPGAKVTDRTGDLRSQLRDHRGLSDHSDRSGGLMTGTRKPQVTGAGWSSVLVATLPPASPKAQKGKLAEAVKALPTESGAWGSGHVLRGVLFSAVVTDDGRVAVGAVAPQTLYDALAG